MSETHLAVQAPEREPPFAVQAPEPDPPWLARNVPTIVGWMLLMLGASLTVGMNYNRLDTVEADVADVERDVGAQAIEMRAADKALDAEGRARDRALDALEIHRVQDRKVMDGVAVDVKGLNVNQGEMMLLLQELENRLPERKP